MGNRPSLRTIIFWIRRFIYMSLVLLITLLVVSVIDDQYSFSRGIIGTNFEMAKPVLTLIWLIAFFLVLLWGFLKWATTVHVMSEKQFFFSKGILNRKKYVVVYENIQNVNVDRSLAEILLGLSTVRIQTAGSKPWESEIELEGIASGETEKLVREITRLVEKARGESGGNIHVKISGSEQEILELRERVKRLEAELNNMKSLLAEHKKKM